MAVLKFLIKTFLYQQAFARLRSQAVVLYIKALELIRQGLLAAIGVVFVLQLMVLGFVGSVTTGVLLLPFESNTKLWILFAAFGLMFLLPAVAIAIALSGRTWMKASGAQELVEDQVKLRRIS